MNRPAAAATSAPRNCLRVSVGATGPFTGPHALHEHYREALTCATAQHQLAGGGAATARTLGFLGLLLSGTSRPEITRYVQDTLAPLQRHDARHGTHLLPTLASYLDRNGSLRRTAEHLHIHANTVLQRLKRAERLLAIDLHAPGTRRGTPPRAARQHPDGHVEPAPARPNPGRITGTGTPPRQHGGHTTGTAPTTVNPGLPHRPHGAHDRLHPREARRGMRWRQRLDQDSVLAGSRIGRVILFHLHRACEHFHFLKKGSLPLGLWAHQRRATTRCRSLQGEAIPEKSRICRVSLSLAVRSSIDS
ncbi:PucR family transcriptional regulator [Streptomyces sp. NPDC055299]